MARETPPGEAPGEQGKHVQAGRFGRALKLGGLATRVAGSAFANAVGKAFGPSTPEAATDAAAQALMQNAERIVQVMGEMKGAVMKVGQLISADPDLVVPEFADSLSKLQRSAPPMPFEMVRAQVEGQLGDTLEALYADFETTPIGAASIGQVHRARLHDGRVVAVKVQYPGIADTLESDLKNLGMVLNVGRVLLAKERLEGFLEEAKVAILDEADYELEARTLQRFRKLFADKPALRIPEPVLGHTARQVLTMEFIEGEKLDDALRRIDDPAVRDQIVTDFVDAFVSMFHDQHVLHADPHPGNFMLDAQGRIVLLDFGCTRAFDPALCDGILDLLMAFWDDDMAEMERLFRALGFGEPGVKYPDAEVLRTYHRIVLEPLMHDGPFDFAGWSVHGRLRTFMRDHLEMLRLPPPPGLLLYLRVLAGIKGQMARMQANVNVRQIAEACCRRHGRLPAGV
jgi:predicted unusual protein kinase regulating ubiquinone biosynthesis (AarF/ABC1/UbiB family)